MCTHHISFPITPHIHPHSPLTLTLHLFILNNHYTHPHSLLAHRISLPITPHIYSPLTLTIHLISLASSSWHTNSTSHIFRLAPSLHRLYISSSLTLPRLHTHAQTHDSLIFLSNNLIDHGGLGCLKTASTLTPRFPYPFYLTPHLHRYSSCSTPPPTLSPSSFLPMGWRREGSLHPSQPSSFSRLPPPYTPSPVPLLTPSCQYIDLQVAAFTLQAGMKGFASLILHGHSLVPRLRRTRGHPLPAFLEETPSTLFMWTLYI